jgi:SecD/SecF fusion protein
MIEKPRLLENSGRQLLLVTVVTVLSIYFMARYEWNLGTDLAGGTELTYEAHIDLAKEQSLVAKDADAQAIMNEMLPVVEDRVNPEGILEASVVQRGENYILIEMPRLPPEETEQVERRIENLGQLEMRIVATDDYVKDGVKLFDLTEEKKRLVAWLDKDNGANRGLLHRSPEHIHRFNFPATDEGPKVKAENLRWLPKKVKRNYRDPKLWEAPDSRHGGTNVVAAFRDEDYAKPPDDRRAQLLEELKKDKPGIPAERLAKIADELTFLVELVPINWAESHFTGNDMDAAGVRATIDQESGLPAVAYVMNTENAQRYADWSEKFKGKQSAIILNGVVHSAPVFQSRIYGSGIIRGSFTQQEASDLAKVLKTGSLRVALSRIGKREIGPTLGAESVRLGSISIAVGSLLILAFVLFYYRLAGVVAFVGLSLNVFLILGVMQFIRATYTLPGLAGIVLTVGMAVDANILVYERVREEVRRGKAVLQAVGAGFERAMSTIMDANITTFLVGVVLYNVGIGPIRGFAVTLMVGIVTSVFTAFFACRLVFHYLLLTGWMKEFRARHWFTQMNFGYLRASKAALVFSIVVIASGLVYMTVVPQEKLLGLDFTGGANLRVVVNRPMEIAEIRGALESHEPFHASYPNPLVNTTGQAEQGRATTFSIKLKLTGEQRTQYGAERREAKSKGEAYEPPYLKLVRAALSKDLVPDPFSSIYLPEDPESATGRRAVVDLNFLRPVEVAKVGKAISSATRLVDIGPKEVTTATKVHVEFATTAMTEAQVEDQLRDLIRSMYESQGEQVAFSDPIPEAEEIGGRMVDELRNAAVGAMILSWFMIIMYVRVRFHEYKYGIAAVLALVHDVLIALIAVAIGNSLGLVNAEIDLGMIAAFLTIVGYSVNDTIVIFDRIRENLSDKQRLGEGKETFAALANRAINQTMSRTILTTGATMSVVIAQFVINYGSGSALEGFSFALIMGMISGTYSTVFLSPAIVLWLRGREKGAGPVQPQPAVPVTV